jgi:hypothetical protein
MRFINANRGMRASAPAAGTVMGTHGYCFLYQL